MARKALKTSDGEGFLRAFTDEWADLESTYGVYLQMRVSPTPRKGVLELRVSAWGEQERRGHQPRAAYTASYPTAQVGTLEACLYQSLVRLEHILAQQLKWPMGKA